MTTEKILERIREALENAEAAVTELRSDVILGAEALGIAFVCADNACDILEDLEKDLLCELSRRPAA